MRASSVANYVREIENPKHECRFWGRTRCLHAHEKRVDGHLRTEPTIRRTLVVQGTQRSSAGGRILRWCTFEGWAQVLLDRGEPSVPCFFVPKVKPDASAPGIHPPNDFFSHPVAQSGRCTPAKPVPLNFTQLLFSTHR